MPNELTAAIMTSGEYTIFPSETDGDLCRFWRGPVKGTWSVTTDEGRRVATCVTLTAAIAAVTEDREVHA
jgi:hypothetical protein